MSKITPQSGFSFQLVNETGEGLGFFTPLVTVKVGSKVYNVNTMSDVNANVALKLAYIAKCANDNDPASLLDVTKRDAGVALLDMVKGTDAKAVFSVAFPKAYDSRSDYATVAGFTTVLTVTQPVMLKAAQLLADADKKLATVETEVKATYKVDELKITSSEKMPVLTAAKTAAKRKGGKVAISYAGFKA